MTLEQQVEKLEQEIQNLKAQAQLARLENVQRAQEGTLAREARGIAGELHQRLYPIYRQGQATNAALIGMLLTIAEERGITLPVE